MGRVARRRVSGGACILTALSLAVGCGSGSRLGTETGASEPSLAPRAELVNVVFEGYRATDRDVEVRAQSARVDLSRRVALLDRVRIAFQGDERGPIQIEADSGELELGGDDLLLRGNVRGSTGAGEQFETDEIRFDEAADRIWTDHPVRVARYGLDLEGEGMELDLRTRRIRFQGGVRARSAQP